MLFDPSPDLSRSVRQVFTRYEILRLQIFRKNPDVDQDIRTINRDDGITLTRFDEVKYFNCVHGATSWTPDLLEDVRTCFQGYSGPVKLGIFPPPRSSVPFPEVARYVRLYADLNDLAESEFPDDRAVNILMGPALDPELFAATYLKVFEAEPARPEAALSNLARLCHDPQIHAGLIMAGDQVAGISVLYQDGEWAFLAGGGVFPEFQNSGLHRISLIRRIRLARELGCKQIVSWTYARNQSCKNMEKLGLKVLFEEPIYLVQSPQDLYAAFPDSTA